MYAERQLEGRIESLERRLDDVHYRQLPGVDAAAHQDQQYAFDLKIAARAKGGELRMEFTLRAPFFLEALLPMCFVIWSFLIVMIASHRL